MTEKGTRSIERVSRAPVALIGLVVLLPLALPMMPAGMSWEGYGRGSGLEESRVQITARMVRAAEKYYGGSVALAVIHLPSSQAATPEACESHSWDRVQTGGVGGNVHIHQIDLPPPSFS